MLEGDPLPRAQEQGDALKAKLLRTDPLGLHLGVSNLSEHRDVAHGIRNIFPASPPDRRDGRGPQSEVIVPQPIAHVVGRFTSRAGVVGCFVVGKASRSEHLFRQQKEIRVEIAVIAVLAALESIKEWRVLLVGEVVSGDVIWFESEGGLQGVPPVVRGLARDREHQVDVDLGKARVAQELDGLRDVGRAVLPPEGAEVLGVERLGPQRDAIHAQLAHRFGRPGAEGGRVRLHGNLGGRREINGRAQVAEESAEVGRGEHGRGPAPEKEGREGGRLPFVPPPIRLAAQGVDKCADGGFPRCVFVERAIRANPVAEWDVNVKMH